MMSPAEIPANLVHALQSVAAWIEAATPRQRAEYHDYFQGSGWSQQSKTARRLLKVASEACAPADATFECRDCKTVMRADLSDWYYGCHRRQCSGGWHHRPCLGAPNHGQARIY